MSKTVAPSLTVTQYKHQNVEKFTDDVKASDLDELRRLAALPLGAKKNKIVEDALNAKQGIVTDDDPFHILIGHLQFILYWNQDKAAEAPYNQYNEESKSSWIGLGIKLTIGKPDNGLFRCLWTGTRYLLLDSSKQFEQTYLDTLTIGSPTWRATLSSKPINPIEGLIELGFQDFLFHVVDLPCSGLQYQDRWALLQQIINQSDSELRVPPGHELDDYYRIYIHKNSYYEWWIGGGTEMIMVLSRIDEVAIYDQIMPENEPRWATVEQKEEEDQNQFLQSRTQIQTQSYERLESNLVTTSADVMAMGAVRDLLISGNNLNRIGDLYQVIHWQPSVENPFKFFCWLRIKREDYIAYERNPTNTETPLEYITTAMTKLSGDGEAQQGIAPRFDANGREGWMPRVVVMSQGQSQSIAPNIDIVVIWPFTRVQDKEHALAWLIQLQQMYEQDYNQIPIDWRESKELWQIPRKLLPLPYGGLKDVQFRPWSRSQVYRDTIKNEIDPIDLSEFDIMSLDLVIRERHNMTWVKKWQWKENMCFDHFIISYTPQQQSRLVEEEDDEEEEVHPVRVTEQEEEQKYKSDVDEEIQIRRPPPVEVIAQRRDEEVVMEDMASLFSLYFMLAVR